MIEIKKLGIRYGSKKVLEEVTHTFAKNYTLLGSNGSGKSSLAKALCDLVECEGEVCLDGRNIKEYDKRELARKIAYVPTRLDLFETEITLFEFVLFGRYAYKDAFGGFDKRDETMVDEKLRFLGLEMLRDHKMRELSSGEMNLALIASALVSEAGMLIFDEPTANLDPKNAKKIAGIIKTLQTDHQILLITHDIELAHFIGFDVLFIKERKLLEFSKGEFFHDKTLSDLYGVEFQDLRVFYA